MLGEVKSQPLRVLIKQMLLNSDNTLAEMLARIVSKESGLGGTAASLQQAIPSALWPDDQVDRRKRRHQGRIRDSARTTASRRPRWRSSCDGSRRAPTTSTSCATHCRSPGKSGTLASRFTGDNAAARGHVTAKTGWIDTAYTLSGFVDAKDGTRLTFAFYAIGPRHQGQCEGRRIDTLVTGVYKCGDNLANYS